MIEITPPSSRDSTTMIGKKSTYIRCFKELLNLKNGKGKGSWTTRPQPINYQLNHSINLSPYCEIRKKESHSTLLSSYFNYINREMKHVKWPHCYFQYKLYRCASQRIFSRGKKLQME